MEWEKLPFFSEEVKEEERVWSNVCIDMDENMGIYGMYSLSFLRKDIGGLKNVKTNLSISVQKQGNLIVSLLNWNQVVQR